MLKIDDDEQTIGGVKFDDLLQFHVAKAIYKEAIEEGKDLTEDELKELTQQSSIGVYPPSEGLGKAFDQLMALSEDQISYSIDLSGLIDELKEDIAEHEAFEDDELVVWAYWTILPNGREVYVDYYFQDEPEDDFDIRFEHDDFFDDFLDDEEDDNVKYIADFDKKMAEEYDNFARKLMPAKKLLEIFEEENRLFREKNMGRFIAAAPLPSLDWITSQLNLTMSAGLLLMLLGAGLIEFGLKGPHQ